MRSAALVTLLVASAAHAAPCDGVEAPAPLPGDMPTAEERLALEDCDSEALYYGFGADADPVAARKCAIVEWAAGDDGILSGAGILFMIYANGQGAARDLQLARAFACAMDSYRSEARLARLEAIESGPGEPVDACEFSWSASLVDEAICAWHADRPALVAQEARQAAVLEGLAPPDRELAEKAIAATDDFDLAQLENETHLGAGGGGRNVTIAASAAPNGARIVARLERMARGEGPEGDVGMTPAAAELEHDRSVDGAQRALEEMSPGSGWASHVPMTESEWLPSRDAWMALARAVDPQHADAWLVELTRERTRQLIDLASN